MDWADRGVWADGYAAQSPRGGTRAVAEGFTHVAFGDFYLEDIRRYREKRPAGSGLTPIFPIWGIPTRYLAGLSAAPAFPPGWCL